MLLDRLVLSRVRIILRLDSNGLVGLKPSSSSDSEVAATSWAALLFTPAFFLFGTLGAAFFFLLAGPTGFFGRPRLFLGASVISVDIF